MSGPVILSGAPSAGRYHATATGLIVPGRQNHPKTQRFLDSLEHPVRRPRPCVACTSILVTERSTGMIKAIIGGSFPGRIMTLHGRWRFWTPCPVCQGRGVI